jgi:hypothetical protein
VSNDSDEPVIPPAVGFRYSGLPDKVIGEFAYGVHEQDTPEYESVPGAVQPPKSDRPAPSKSVAERLRELFEKGGA